MIKSILNFIKEKNLIKPNDKIVVGFSGGPDSTFLLHILKQLQSEFSIEIIAAHLNHEWRDLAEKDEQFCTASAKTLKIPIDTRKISELSFSAKFNGSKEEVGRLYRQHFLETIRRENNAHTIALGHTADDQQENFFIRMLRGASISGLSGIKPKRGYYIRPLLQTKKKDIVDFLNKNNFPFIVDPTNKSDDFLRNRVRNHVIPSLEKADPRFNKTFSKTLKSLQSTEDFLEQNSEEKFSMISEIKNGKIVLSAIKLSYLHTIIQQRIIILWLCKEGVPFVPSEGLINEIIRFLNSSRGGKHILYAKWAIEKKQGVAHISRI